MYWHSISMQNEKKKLKILWLKWVDWFDVYLQQKLCPAVEMCLFNER